MDVLSQGFVETETEWQLVDCILRGAWCLLVGHRQSGKSSTVQAARQILEASGQQVQLVHTSLEKGHASSGELWHFLADRMHVMDPIRFPLADPAELAVKPLSLMWGWFCAREGGKAVALAIDEAALLGSIQDIVEVMAELRALRDAQGVSQLRCVVLVGTEAVVRLLEAVICNNSARYYRQSLG